MSQDALMMVLQGADATSNTSFGPEDVRRWPPGQLAALQACGVLGQADHTTSVICPGCPRRCLAEVDIIDDPDGGLPRAYVVCEERDDIGRVAILLEQLKEWRVSLDALAEVIAQQIGASGIVEDLLPERLWRVGQVLVGEARADVFMARGTRQDDAAGVFGQSQALQGSALPVVLSLSDAPAQEVFGERVRTIPLFSMLSVEGGKLRVEMRAITKEIRRGQRRLRASLAKPAAIPDPVLVIRPKSYQVLLRGDELRLSALLFKLLLFLAQHAEEGGGGWARREDIYDAVWTPEGQEPTVNLSQVDDTVRELRNAFNSAEPGSGTQLIDTLRDVGYRLRLKPPELVIRLD